jgi:hypothetical protein
MFASACHCGCRDQNKNNFQVLNVAKTYRCLRAGFAACVCISLPQAAFASGFIEDSSANLILRNYYFDRDYKGTSSQSAAREWAQGAILNVSSGFTPGAIGFGLNAQGLLGLRLDSSADRYGTGLLPYDPATHEPANEYSELGLTAKAKMSRTELQAGTISTLLPVAFASPTRLLPQTFRGAYLRSKDLGNFTLHVGWFDRMNQRDSTNYQKMSVAAPNGRFNGAATSDQFAFLGADYQWSTGLVLKYYHAELQDMYQKNYYGFEHVLPIGEDRLKTDFRYFVSGEAGAAKAGQVDNRNLGVMVTYSHGPHKVGAGFMQLSGSTAMPYLAGTEPLVISEGALSTEFLNAHERSWQTRYDYDFAAAGIPGFKGMLRYLQGNDIELPTRLGGDGLSESEKDIELSYVVQAGSFKNLAFRVRHAWYRNDFASTASFRDDNELRINIDYTLALW